MALKKKQILQHIATKLEIKVKGTKVIIAMAIVAIIAKVAYSSYQESLIRANEENAKHKLVNLMQEMEKYYATHGAYSATSGAWPAAVSQKIASLNANSKEPYTYTVYPLEPAGNDRHLKVIPSKIVIRHY